MTEEILLVIMGAVDSIPFGGKSGKRRTIYEAQASGHFFIDFPCYSGSTEEISKQLIDRLELEGKLVRAFPNSPHINGWVLP